MHQVGVPGSRRPASAAARSLPCCPGLRELGVLSPGLPPAVGPRPLCTQGARHVSGGAPFSPDGPRALRGFRAGVGGARLIRVVRLVGSVRTWGGVCPHVACRVVYM